MVGYAGERKWAMLRITWPTFLANFWFCVVFTNTKKNVGLNK